MSMIPQHGKPNRGNAMGAFTLILLGFVLGWIAQHFVVTMSETACGFVRKLQGVRRIELDFRDDEDRPKLRK